jgi:hypothetical protein
VPPAHPSAPRARKLGRRARLRRHGRPAPADDRAARRGARRRGGAGAARGRAGRRPRPRPGHLAGGLGRGLRGALARRARSGNRAEHRVPRREREPAARLGSGADAAPGAGVHGSVRAGPVRVGRALLKRRLVAGAAEAPHQAGLGQCGADRPRHGRLSQAHDGRRGASKRPYGFCPARRPRP